MAVSSTIRCKVGISNFLLPTENCEDFVSAFKYKDNTVEVHSLKKDCAPLYLEENTTVNLLTNESFGTVLLAITASYLGNCLNFRVWDVNMTHGFIPKDLHLKVEHKKEGKFHCMFDVQKMMKEELKNHICATLGSMLCLLLNGKLCILMSARKNDMGVISFDVKISFFLNDLSSPVIDVLFLKEQQKTYLLFAEGTNVSVMLVENDQLTNSAVVNIPIKKSKATAISHLLRITCSKCLVVDNTGHLSLLSVPNNIVSLKFPSSIGGHGICTAVGFRHTSEGILAICNGDHTINLYSLADIITSIHNGVVSYVKPYRVLCSQFPINSLSFVRHDQLAMASTVNQSITFWGGLSQQI